MNTEIPLQSDPQSRKRIIANRAFVTTQNASYWDLAAYILLAVFFLIILATFRHYGITYDEFWRNDYGNAIIQWYQSGFQNTHALTTFDYQYYGSFFTVVQQLFSRVSFLGVYETNHLVNALTSLLTVFIAYKLGRRLGNPLVGFLAALFLIINPRYYGHSFNNPIDLPLATVYLISLYLIVMLIESLPKLPKIILLSLGVVIGIALGIRLSSLILFVYLAVAIGSWLFTKTFLARENRLSQKEFFGIVVRSLFWIAAIGLVAYAVMIVWWPAAQIDPIRQPVRSLRYFLVLDNPFTVLFNGREILNTELPWYYQIYWFLISMPEYLLLSLGIGVVIGLYSNRTIERLRQNLMGRNNLAIGMVIFSIVIPLVYTAVRTPTAYDGIRHFLFLIPPLSIMAAYAVSKLLELTKGRWLKFGLVALVISSLLLTIVDMIRLHPDEYIYFNRLFGGGVARASTRYDLDYWGNSYKEAVEWLDTNYSVPAGSPKPKVASCLFSLSTSNFLNDNQFEYIGTYHDGQKISGTPDIFLSSTRWHCDQKQSGEVVHEITRMGATLVKIVKVAR